MQRDFGTPVPKQSQRYCDCPLYPPDADGGAGRGFTAQQKSQILIDNGCLTT